MPGQEVRDEIGTNALSAAGLGNGYEGVVINSGAQPNQIGVPGAVTANTAGTSEFAQNVPVCNKLYLPLLMR